MLPVFKENASKKNIKREIVKVELSCHPELGSQTAGQWTTRGPRPVGNLASSKGHLTSASCLPLPTPIHSARGGVEGIEAHLSSASASCPPPPPRLPQHLTFYLHCMNNIVLLTESRSNSKQWEILMSYFSKSADRS